MLDTMEIIKGIPPNLRKKLVDRLVDLVLESKKGDNMPTDLAKIILYYWQHNDLTSDISIEILIKAALFLEPETLSILLKGELGSNDLFERFNK